jgi:hypothetical protein
VDVQYVEFPSTVLQPRLPLRSSQEFPHGSPVMHCIKHDKTGPEGPEQGQAHRVSEQHLYIVAGILRRFAADFPGEIRKGSERSWSS